jgi:hypothetical protein
MPHSVDCTRSGPPRKTSLPFAALPHDLAADPRLSPTDVRVLLALLYFAKAKPDCWPGDRSIAARIGRSIGTVQRCLRKLEALGLVERRPAHNPTGRTLVLRWRATPDAPVSDPPAAPARDEGRRETEEQRPESAAAPMSGPPPPAGRKEAAEPPPSAGDLARFRAWAAGPDPALARFGRAALKLAGVAPEAIEPAPEPAPESGAVVAVASPPVAPAEIPAPVASAPVAIAPPVVAAEAPPPVDAARTSHPTPAAAPARPPAPRPSPARAPQDSPSRGSFGRPAPQARRAGGVRHVLESFVGELARSGPSALPLWRTRPRT